MLSKSVSTKLFYLIVAAIYAVMLFLVGRNLFIPDLWYDESGQVFISHGLNHFSDPLLPGGSLADVLRANHDYNLDPGGFSVLLYFWCKVSSNHIWLRLLPFIFYLGAIVFTCLISCKIFRDRKIGAVAGLLVFALIGGYFAFEVRAYSMELCGVAFSVWMVLTLRDRQSVRKTLLFSLILCFFITSRYTMLVIAGLLSCIVLFELYRQYRNHTYTLHQLCTRATAYALPLIITVGLIWFFQARIQNSGIEPLSYISYLQKGTFMKAFCLIGLIIIGTWKWVSGQIRTVIFIFALVNITFIILGFFEKLPWMLLDNKGAVFLYLFYIALFNTALFLLKKSPRLFPYLHGLALGGAVIILIGAARYGLANTSHWWDYLQDSIDCAVESSEGTIYIGAWDSPSVRYLYEFGAFKNRAAQDHYPEKFYFLKKGNHRMGEKKTNFRLHNVDILYSAPSGTVVLLTNRHYDSIPPCYEPVAMHIYKKR